MSESIILQVLISTFGQRGIDSVAVHSHPVVDGVEYLVSLQNPEGDVTIPDRLKRPDFKIITHPTRGISANRNRSINEATAELAIISDDDVDFDAEELKQVIDAFRQRSDADVITFKYHSAGHEKNYPSHEADLKQPPKGYFTTSIEIAFRLKRIKYHAKFNENFGIGTSFPCGEENIFIHDIIKKGFKVVFVPIYSCRHDGIATGTRDRNKPEFIMTHGAVMSHLHPWSWPLRIMVHAWRHSRTKGNMNFFAYIANALKGVAIAHRKNVFK